MEEFVGKSFALKASKTALPSYGFSIDPRETANALRKLADAFDMGEVLLTKAAQFRVTAVDDFETSGIVLHFCVRNT